MTAKHRQRPAWVAAIACAWLGFALVGSATAGFDLATPVGLSPGQTFRFVFATAAFTDATNTDIAYYNAFVNTDANGATYNGSVVAWKAIASTQTQNAFTNVGAASAPVYLTSGARVANDTTLTGLWSGSLLHAINWTISGPYTYVGLVWTGTASNGDTAAGLGTATPTVGSVFQSNSGWIDGFEGPPASSRLGGLFGISEILTVPVPEPSSLVTAGIGVVLGLVVAGSRRR